MATSYQLTEFMRNLEAWGLLDVMLPFLLIFTIVFATLQKTEILGKEKRNFNTIIALVFSLLVVIPHVTGSYAQNYDPVVIMNAFLPGIAMVMVAVIALFILIGMWGGEAKWAGGTPSFIIFILAIIAVVWIFGAAANWWDGWSWANSFFGQEVVSIVIIVLVFGIIIRFITGSDKPSEGASIIKQFGDMFKK